MIARPPLDAFEHHQKDPLDEAFARLRAEARAVVVDETLPERVDAAIRREMDRRDRTGWAWADRNPPLREPARQARARSARAGERTLPRWAAVAAALVLALGVGSSTHRARRAQPFVHPPAPPPHPGPIEAPTEEAPRSRPLAADTLPAEDDP